MDLGLYMVGEAAKRGLVARLPSGQRLMGDAGDWLTGEVPDLVRSVRLDRNGEDAASLFVDIHPAAPSGVVQETSVAVPILWISRWR